MLSTVTYILRHPLGRRRPLRTLWRYVAWQVGARMRPQPIVVAFVEGARLAVRRGMHGATGNVYLGLHEAHDMAFTLHVLREGDLFLDVGANVGSYSVLAGKVAGARVVAFEPVPATFEALRHNLALNALDGLVSARRLALGARASSVRFSTDRDCMNAVVTAEYSGASVEVQVVPLDDLPEAAHASLWKVDVEGFEEEFLKGAGRTLAEAPPAAIIMEMRSPWIEQCLGARGFRRRSYDLATRLLSDPVPGRANDLWVRDEAFVAARCRDARRFEVRGIAV